MHKGYLKTAALLGALAVILGAFGAHTLKKYLSPEALATFETGVRYQFYHVFALALAGILWKDFPHKSIRYAGICFITGIILFSFSLYFLSWVNYANIPSLRFIGIITPIGGVSFIAGWLLMAIGIFNKK